MASKPVNAYHKSKTPPLRLAWAIWGWGAAFYLVGFFLRVTPAVMTAELMQAFNINATALGNLSAFYFYSYVAMQIPTGILADIWGPRRLLTTGAFIAGTGILIFALAPSIAWAYLGRFLIGGSVAVAFVGTLKLAARMVSSQIFSPRFQGLPCFLVLSGRYSPGHLCGSLSLLLAGAIPCWFPLS